MEVWLRQPNFGHPWAHWTGILITAGQWLQAQRTPSRFRYVHTEIADLEHGIAYSAEVPGVVRLNAAEEITNYTADGSVLMAYGFVPEFTIQEALAARVWLDGIVDRGTPYDGMNIAFQAVRSLAALVGMTTPIPLAQMIARLPIPDVAGLWAFTCSKLLAAFGNRYRGWGVNMAEFNPCDVPPLVDKGLLVELGPRELGGAA